MDERKPEGACHVAGQSPREPQHESGDSNLPAVSLATGETASPSGSASPETPLAYRAVRGGLWVIGSSYWTIGFGFVATLVLTRLLLPEAFGEFALAMFFVQLMRLQPRLGVGYAFAQQKGMDGQAIGTFLVLDLSAAVAGFLLMLIAAPVLSYLGYAPGVVQTALVLALAAMAESLVSTGGTFLEKEMRFAPTSLIQSIVFPLSYLPAFWLAVEGRGVWALVAQNVTYNLLFVVATWWTVRWRMPQLWQMRWRFDACLARQFIRFGLTVGLMLLAGLVLTQLDNFMIGTFVGITVLGFYDRAYRTAQWPTTLLSSLISRAAFYTYARLQDDLVRLQKTVTMMLWIITTLAMPIALVILITAPDLIRLLYGDRWLPSTLFLRILVVYAVMRPLWENAGSLFIAIGKPALTTRFTVIQALVLAGAGLPLTILWGALGTCVAVGMAFVTGLVLTYRQLAREIPIRVVQTLGWPVAIAAGVVLGYWVLNPVVGLNDFPLVVRVAAKSAYAVAGFFGLMVLLQPRATMERLSYIWRLARSTGREGRL